MKGMTLSLISGMLAAAASVCGKFSMAAEETLFACEAFVMHLYGLVGNPNEKIDIPAPYTAHIICENVIIVIRLSCFIIMIVCNAVMWTLFTKALRLCATTLEATVTNTAANFFFTAIFGQVIFGESLTFLWWLGTIMIIIGLLLMHKGNQAITEGTNMKGKKNKRS